jgi:integrase
MLTKHTRRPRGSVYRRPDSPYWYIAFSRCGVKVRENTHLLSEKAAKKLLDSRLGNIADGKALPHDLDKTTVGELFELVRKDYRFRGRKSIRDMELRIRLHLAPFFYVVSQDGKYAGGMKANQVTSVVIDNYIIGRQAGGASNATVNRELSVLRFGFKLGVETEPQTVAHVPNFPHLKEPPARKGFLEDAHYHAITKAAPELWFRAMVEVAKTYGWRRSELTGLRCSQVDLMNRSISLDPGTTKNDDARCVFMTDAMYTLLSACVRDRKPDDYVFTRANGSPVRDFRKTWRNACVAAGVGHWVCPKCEGQQPLDTESKCPRCFRTWTSQERRYRGAIFHDWRRTGVRSMVRSGIPEATAMKLSGHRTRNVFERYNIVSEGDRRDAARRLNKPGPTETELGPVSVPFAHAANSTTVN